MTNGSANPNKSVSEGTPEQLRDLAATTQFNVDDTSEDSALQVTSIFPRSEGKDARSDDDSSDDNFDAHEQELANCITALSERLQNGENISLMQACDQYPQFAEDIRQIWGTVLVANAVGEDGLKSLTEDIVGRHDLVLPEVVGDYEIQEVIGKGGMGIVYRAYQHKLGREVAIKMIQRSRSSKSEEMKRFFVEAEATARLSHPHIVRIFEFGELKDLPFFSMELVRGETFLNRLAQGPVPQRQAVQVLAPICRAIAYAHRQGIVHRDIKPSNILLDEHGTPKLTDFGLAKMLDSTQDDITKTGAIIGTPTYMSPEQASAREGQIGPASDIYSIGSVLYHSLTGRPPLVANSPIELAVKIVEQDPPALRLLEPRIDRDLEMIVTRCLQKPPDLRYKTADDLADDLEAFLRDEPISARSGKLNQVLGRIFRETHHAPILENWGLLWMWHSLVVLVACFMTEWLKLSGVTDRYGYTALWTVGLGTWAAVFWAFRRRMGPVTFVERQIAHLWGASMIAIACLFPLEWWLSLPTLALSPMLGVITSMIFLIKAGILSGVFYIQAACLFVCAILMAIFPLYAHAIFGVVCCLSFFIPGLKYYRQRNNKSS